DANSRRLGFDRFELAAIFRVGIRFGIEGVELAHAAGEPQMDDGDNAFGGRGGLRLQAEYIPQAPISEKAERTDFQKRAPIEVVHSAPQWLNRNSFELKIVHRTSSNAARRAVTPFARTGSRAKAISRSSGSRT